MFLFSMISATSSPLRSSMFFPFRTYCRIRPLVFSLRPRQEGRVGNPDAGSSVFSFCLCPLYPLSTWARFGVTPVKTVICFRASPSMKRVSTASQPAVPKQPTIPASNASQSIRSASTINGCCMSMKRSSGGVNNPSGSYTGG